MFLYLCCASLQWPSGPLPSRQTSHIWSVHSVSGVCCRWHIMAAIKYRRCCCDRVFRAAVKQSCYIKTWNSNILNLFDCFSIQQISSALLIFFSPVQDDWCKILLKGLLGPVHSFFCNLSLIRYAWKMYDRQHQISSMALIFPLAWCF